MEYPSGAGGEIAAEKRAKLPWHSVTSVDRLSALNDDILAKILSSVSSPDAVRTSVLFKRWPSVWKLLPDLHFPFIPEPAGSFCKAVDGHEVTLRDLKVEGHGHGRGQGGLPRSLATWLPAAARRVTGNFTLCICVNEAPARNARLEDEAAAAIELPCFEQATSISLGLGFRARLAFPAADDAGVGVFSRLTELSLKDVWFQDPSALGDAISSARCPCLQIFHLCRGRGLEKLAVSSASLLKLVLERLCLRELTVEAPELKEFHVLGCFSPPRGVRELPPPVVSITAPGLVEMDWRDTITEDAIGFGHRLPHLRSLGSFYFFVYGDDDADSCNRECLRILLGFQFIKTLTFILFMNLVMDNDGNEYLMETISALPDITTLHLIVMSDGHSFLDSSLHVLRICTGIRKLVLQLSTPEFEVVFVGSGQTGETEELALVSLEEIEIQGFGESQHDIGFVEQLFGWATSLTKATIFFDESVIEGVAKELCWMFQFFSTPKLHIDFRYYNNKKVLCAPEE